MYFHRKSDENDKNLDITANGDIKTPEAVEDTTESQSSETDSSESEEKSLEVIVAEQSKQLEAMTESLKAKEDENTSLKKEIEQLKSDIASLRENPFYKATEVPTRPSAEGVEFTSVDVAKMRNRI